MKNVEYRIGGARKTLMVSVAIFFDSVQLLTKAFHVIPGVGTFAAILIGWTMSILAWLTFFLWFSLAGVKPFSGRKQIKKFILNFGSGLIEAIPILNALPMWSVYVWWIIRISREEDKENQKERLESQTRYTQPQEAANDNSEERGKMAA
ncbi:MAG: hypothetical protein WDZ90_02645 [Candidatus Paceibacterota bacterium]